MRPFDNVTLVVSGLALTNPHVGQGVYTLRLIQGLTKCLGNRLVVVAPATVPKLPEINLENFLTLPPLRAPGPALISHGIASHHLLRLVAARFPGAIFHSPGPIAGLRRPAKTIVTLHDCLYRHFPNYHGRFFVRRVLSHWAERFAAGATLILTDSEFSRRDLIARAHLPAEKIEILYPWVGNEFLRALDPGVVECLRTRLRLPERFWLYLGGYDYRKNVEFLLEAYAAAGRRKELPPLVLAGEIPEAQNIATCDVPRALARNGLMTKQVIRTGPIPASDLPALFRAAALLVYPSLGEGFGLPPAEAMSVGTPVLASNAMSLPEVVRNSHCLFDPRDISALIEKLIAATRDEAQFTAELSLKFTESSGVERYLQLISEIE